MSFVEILLISLGLASDAFAVSVSAGSSGTVHGTRSKVRLAFHFGFFQFLMPVFGWLAGLSVVQYVHAIDHWIAFALLVWVAIHMFRSIKEEKEHSELQDPSRGMVLVVLSVTTSLDALAVGLSLALLEISIWYPAFIIGIVTGTTSFIGINLGGKFSKKFGKRAALMGSILLVLIGIRILLTHLFAF